MKKKKFIVYIPAGYPNISVTYKLLNKFNNLPVDGVEIGIPFSDPIADGPVIQKAHNVALKNNVSLNTVFDILKKLKLKYEVYFMSYLNPIINYPHGKKKLIENLKLFNIKALIIPDLPIVEFKKINLSFPLIPFAAPNISEKEIKIINTLKAPFVYYIARYGITGEREDIPFKSKIIELKSKIKLPLYIGFGISTREQVKQAFELADGVIVGSTIVKELDERNELKILNKVEAKILNLTKI